MTGRIITGVKVLAWTAVVAVLAAAPALLVTGDETLYAVLTKIPYVGSHTDGIVNRKNRINAALEDYAGGWIASLTGAFDDGTGGDGAAGKTKVVVPLPATPGASAGAGWQVSTQPAPGGKEPAGAIKPPPPPAAVGRPAPLALQPPPPPLAQPTPPARTATAPPPMPKPKPVPRIETKRPPPESATPPKRQMAAAPPPAATPVAKPAVKDETAEQDHRRGMLFYKGIGVDKDFKKAAMWFRRAANKGNAAAQYNLGIMSYLGQGVEQDYAKAADWFQKAADQDHAAAQYNLGFLYFEGRGVPKDTLQAYMWIDRSANLGDDKAAKARDTLQKALPKEIFQR